jgi:protein-S-isoprenylcysteine O-methyltransferase Ste14
MLNSTFFIGCIILGYVTFSLALPLLPGTPLWRLVLFGGAAVCFFALLMFALFFAIPFEETYISQGGVKKVCRTGMYGMCRHPGVLWFAGFYLFLYLAVPSFELLIAALAFNAANVVYILWQDGYLFPKTFADYDDYKLSVPLLIPKFFRGR